MSHVCGWTVLILFPLYDTLDCRHCDEFATTIENQVFRLLFVANRQFFSWKKKVPAHSRRFLKKRKKKKYQTCLCVLVRDKSLFENIQTSHWPPSPRPDEEKPFYLFILYPVYEIDIPMGQFSIGKPLSSASNSRSPRKGNRQMKFKAYHLFCFVFFVINNSKTCTPPPLYGYMGWEHLALLL